MWAKRIQEQPSTWGTDCINSIMKKGQRTFCPFAKLIINATSAKCGRLVISDGYFTYLVIHVHMCSSKWVFSVGPCWEKFKSYRWNTHVSFCPIKCCYFKFSRRNPSPSNINFLIFVTLNLSFSPTCKQAVLNRCKYSYKYKDRYRYKYRWGVCLPRVWLFLSSTLLGSEGWQQKWRRVEGRTMRTLNANWLLYQQDNFKLPKDFALLETCCPDLPENLIHLIFLKSLTHLIQLLSECTHVSAFLCIVSFFGQLTFLWEVLTTVYTFRFGLGLEVHLCMKIK